jgi:hypothetical protein
MHVILGATSLSHRRRRRRSRHQPGNGIGDLGVLYEFEQAVLAAGLPTSIVRAAYYMSKWDSALDTARDEGVVRSGRMPIVRPCLLRRHSSSVSTRSHSSESDSVAALQLPQRTHRYRRMSYIEHYHAV